jgi:signal transduction histidine kinase
MVQRFVEQMGGALSVQSEPGHGATFRLVFRKTTGEQPTGDDGEE